MKELETFRKFLNENQALGKEMAPYADVESVIRAYEDDNILNDFIEEFKGKDMISKKEFFDFSQRYYDDMSELAYTRANWKYITTGDESVFDDL